MKLSPINWLISVNNYMNEKVFNTPAGRVAAAVASAGVLGTGAYLTYSTANFGNFISVCPKALRTLNELATAAEVEAGEELRIACYPHLHEAGKTILKGVATILGTKFFAEKALAKPAARKED